MYTNYLTIDYNTIYLEYIDNHHSDGKWNISFDEWPWKHYPHYYLGPAVLIQGNTILRLLAAIQTTPMMPFDDVYYSGICTEKAGIKIYHFYSSNRYTLFSFISMGLNHLQFPILTNSILYI